MYFHLWVYFYKDLFFLVLKPKLDSSRPRYHQWVKILSLGAPFTSTGGLSKSVGLT